mgnify:CR=1 FL=1
MSTNPLWFVSLVWCETALQLPFFFVAAYAFIKRANWIRVPCIIYGAHVATTMVRPDWRKGWASQWADGPSAGARMLLD